LLISPEMCCGVHQSCPADKPGPNGILPMM
jgi:hypothetical protein